MFGVLPKDSQSLHQKRPIKSYDIINVLAIFPVYKKLHNTEANEKYICKGWNGPEFHFRPKNVW
jgi:hypothetical protein